MRLSFVHAADIHLDSPFAGLADVDPEIAELCRSATFHAFDNIINLALRKRVDFLLVGGDVYDGSIRSLRAQLAFRKGLEQLADAGIRTYVVHGNHDPLSDWSSTLKWPEAVCVFGSEGVESVFHDCRSGHRAVIHGRSFSRREVRENLAQEFKRNSDDLFQIGLLHCNVGSDTGHKPYAPCTLDDLVSSRLDYWALGHVHFRNVLMQKSPTIAYPGIPQGRHTRESGPRGCYYVEVADDGDVALTFVATDEVRWFDQEVDVGYVGTEQSLLEELEATLGQIQRDADGRAALVRITLTGRTKLHDILQKRGYLEDLTIHLRDHGGTLQTIVWAVSVLNRTRVDVDVTERRRSQDFIGDLLRLAEEYRTDELKLAELSGSLKPLFGDRRLRNILAFPSQAELKELLSEAESICLDRLLEDAGQ